MSCLQIAFHVLQPASIDIRLRRDSQHSLEHALEMKRAAPELPRQHAERQPVFEMLFNVAARRPDQRRLRIAIHRLRTAAQARAISGLLGIERAIIKLHIAPPRTLRWARWPA